MTRYAGYVLIILGALLLAYNLGYLNLSILTNRIAVPVAFIILGLIDLILSLVDLGDLSRAVKLFSGLLLAFIILLNLGYLITISISAGLNSTLYNATTQSEHECNFCTKTIMVNNSGSHSFSDSFSTTNYDLSNVTSVAGVLSLKNNFGTLSATRIGMFSEIDAESNMGSMNLHTGTILGSVLLRIDNSFGNVNVYVDNGVASYVESDAALGSVNNYLNSSNYSSATNRIHIIAESNFGSISIYPE